MHRAARVARTTLPIDQRGVRSSHLTHAAPNTAGIAPAAPGASSPSSGIRRYVPDTIAEWFGNLPAETQRFLTSPFRDAGRPPQDGHLDASLTEIGYGVHERYVCYLYGARDVAVVEAHRFVARASGAMGQQLWNASPERRLLEAQPWTVSAFVAPVARPHAAVVPRPS